MTSQSAVRRNARALFDVVARTGDPQPVSAELSAFAALMEEHTELRQVLTSPAVAPAVKRRVLDEVLAKARASDTTTQFLRLLADRDSLPQVPDLARAYEQRLLEYQQVVHADVTTAVALSEDHAQALQRVLSEATGKKVQISTQVDRSIIGGVVARIGSRIYDGSVKRQLQRIKERLVEGAA
jgi:F-type H+-transporting ATPase subunit delta